MRFIALCAGVLLASTAAYADSRRIFHRDDMQTARADIRADRRAAALARANSHSQSNAQAQPQNEENDVVRLVVFATGKKVFI